VSVAGSLDTRKLLLALVLAAAAALSWWGARRLAAPEQAATVSPRHEPDYTIDNFVVTVLSEQGQTRYILRAARLEHYPDDGSSELDQPYLIEYGEPGSAPQHTRADHGRMPKNRASIDLSGNVRSARGRDPKGAGGEIRAQRMHIQLDRKK
jgi:lipopolysaccharide export system protein LptC